MPEALAGPAELSAHCRRCGQCCLAGGPTLLTEDLPLLESGSLPLRDLICLRAGEWARDDSGAQSRLLPLPTEMLKLAGTGQGAQPWRCKYASSTGCGMYAQRPWQCRLLLCTRTGPLEERLAQGGFLHRRHVLALALPQADAARRALWLEVLEAHDEACPAARCLELALAARAGGLGGSGGSGKERASARAELDEMIRYDTAFRALCVERGAALALSLPFLLGRPLAELARHLPQTPGPDAS